jgi:hypothetical protein
MFNYFRNFSKRIRSRRLMNFYYLKSMKMNEIIEIIKGGNMK